MKFIKFLWQISWKHILIAALAGLFSGWGNALLLSVINREVHQGRFSAALIYFAILAIFILVTSIIAQLMLIHLSQKAIYELRLNLSKNILTSPLEHLERLRENRLFVMLTDDIKTLTHAVSAIPNIIIDFATIIGCFFYLAWISNIVFLISISLTAVAISFVQIQLTKTQRLFNEAREEEDTLFKYFQAIINGTKELKLNRWKREEFLEKNLQGSAANLRQKNTKAASRFLLANGVGQMSQFLSLGFILFILPLALQLPMPVLASYVLISTAMALPMQNLLNRIPELVRGNVSLRKIERMQMSLVNLAEPETVPAACGEVHQLQLKNITYRYHPDLPPADRPQPHGEALPSPPQHDHQSQRQRQHPPHPYDRDRRPPPGHQPPPHPPQDAAEQGFLLGPISLSLRSGELVFIVGGNGSGKSTLAKLAMGLYAPQSGTIYLNGEPITASNVEWYRQHFAATFADSYLFDSYLGFRNPHLDHEVQSYLKQFQLDRKVQVQNGVLSTIDLSQGQRKRLSLLAALLEDRPIYLFDEWAADQDPEFRDLFYQEILMQLKQLGKILIVITHDDRYFHLADHLIKLSYGQIESDRHQ